MLGVLQRGLSLRDLLLSLLCIHGTCLDRDLHLLDELLGLLHHLLTCEQSDMLHDVRHDSQHRVRRSLNQGQLVERDVRLDVLFMLLIRECLQRSADQRPAVLHDGVHGLRFLRRRKDLVDVLDLERLIHPAVRRVQVVHLGAALGQPQLLLSQRHPLGHREDVRVADRQHVYPPVEVLRLELLRSFLNLVGVGGGHVFANDPCKDLELLALGVIQPLVDRGQNFHTALE